MYSRQEVEALDVGGVVKFAQEQGLDQEDVAVLRKEKIDGSVLERMTVDGFMKAGMKMGPAEKLMKALDKVFGRGKYTRLRFFLLFLYIAFHLPPSTSHLVHLCMLWVLLARPLRLLLC
jgi:hypothetical protein